MWKIQADIPNLIITVKGGMRIMFLLWLGIFIICCLAEEAKDSYKAYKYHQKGGFYAGNPCFKPQQKNYPYVDKFCKDFEAWYEEYNKNN